MPITTAAARPQTAPEARYATVAVPVPLDQAYTYTVPEGLTVEPGMRVLVPWGKRRLVGLVLEVAASPPPDVTGLRPIDLALDAAPILEPSLLVLARWTAAYYQAPIGEALRCALPPAAELREKRWLRLTEAGQARLQECTAHNARPALEQSSLFTSQQSESRRSVKTGSGQALHRGAAAHAALLDAAQSGLSLDAALRRFDAAAVRAAVQPGWLRLETDVVTGVAAPTVRAYRLRDAATSAAAQGRPWTATQQQVIELLRAAGGQLDAADLAPLVSAAALLSLRRRGAIEACSREAEPASPEWRARPRVAALNAEQHEALATIVARLPPAPGKGAGTAAPRGLYVVLLHGVTGSGKTAVYLEAIEACLARGGSALMLVPEIGLTPAVFADFEDAFPGQVAVQHSGLTAAERAQQWHRARRGESRVVIGTRSAIFMPLPRLGLIIVDEEHDGAYKQQETPRYHARDLAVLRGKLCGAAVVLGSATPSLESYEHARAGKYALATLRARVEQRPLPVMRMVDMCAEFRARSAAPAAGAGPARGRAGAGGGGRRDADSETALSAELIAAIGQRLERGEQAVVLINRRGYAPVVVCRACGQAVSCRDCALSLTYHKRAQRLLCHACGYATPVPERCPACGSDYIYFLGAGSEKIEEALAGLFPTARIARLDRDTARGRRHFSRVLGAFRAGQFDLLVGTQMIAKGHDLPGVTLVGVVHADLGLAIPEFRAAERTFQLLTQVAGRAGRGQIPGEVILQLLHPEHYAVQAALRADYALFHQHEARYRRLLLYPPYMALALVQVRHRDYDQALGWTTALGRFWEEQFGDSRDIRLVGPAPAPVPRLKAEHRFQFVLKSARRKPLAAALTALRAFAVRLMPATALAIDVDPQSWN